MIAVSKSAGATLANGALTLWAQNSAGLLADVYAASVQVLDAADTSVMSKTALDVGTATPTGSHAGTGQYHAAWAGATSAAVGKYIVRWFYKWTADSAEESFDQEVEVVAKPYLGPHYCTVYDLAAEGISSSLSAERLQALIVRASRLINQVTGRSAFEPRLRGINVDGSGTAALLLGEPIVAVLDATIDSDSVVESLKVFNRHVREGLTDPDDRQNPKLELVSGGGYYGAALWPYGRQNVRVTGLFGYTETDGSMTGGTPAMIREAAKLLAFEFAEPISDRIAAPGAIVEEGTRDQYVKYAAVPIGKLTGSLEVDTILAGFIRPPSFGAA